MTPDFIWFDRMLKRVIPNELKDFEILKIGDKKIKSICCLFFSFISLKL